jgi:hypothetical protein
LCAVALFGSFSLTLWLSAPQQFISDKTGGNESVQPTTTVSFPGSTRRLYVEKLAHREVSSYADLPGTAQALGFDSSNRMRGFVDGIERINNREVTANGWLLDAEVTAPPWI